MAWQELMPCFAIQADIAQLGLLHNLLVQLIQKVPKAPILLPTAQPELDTMEHQAQMLRNVQSIQKVSQAPLLLPIAQLKLDTMVWQALMLLYAT